MVYFLILVVQLFLYRSSLIPGYSIILFSIIRLTLFSFSCLYFSDWILVTSGQTGCRLTSGPRRSAEDDGALFQSEWNC